MTKFKCAFTILWVLALPSASHAQTTNASCVITETDANGNIVQKEKFDQVQSRTNGADQSFGLKADSHFVVSLNNHNGTLETYFSDIRQTGLISQTTSKCGDLDVTYMVPSRTAEAKDGNMAKAGAKVSVKCVRTGSPSNEPASAKH